MDGKEIVRIINVKLADLGMSKADFTALTGVSRSSLSQWNSGKSMPSAESLHNINNVLGTDFQLSNKTDNVYATIQMLQSLRDADRALLEVAKDMPEDQVRKMADFMRSLKGDKD